MTPVSFTKPGRVGYQYANSERDIAWLLKEGWQQVKPKEPEAKRPILKVKKHDNGAANHQ